MLLRKEKEKSQTDDKQNNGIDHQTMFAATMCSLAQFYRNIKQMFRVVLQKQLWMSIISSKRAVSRM